MIFFAQPPVLGLITDLQSTFQSMPGAGKVFVYGLLVMSAVSWSIIFSKLLLLLRIRKADHLFKARLRQSRTCLEIYEKQGDFAPSQLFEIYDFGARSVAREMVGLEDPRYLLENNLLAGGRLNSRQLGVVGKALADGEGYVSNQLRRGFKTLGVITLAAPVVAVIGGAWAWLAGMYLANALFIIWISFAVAGCAGFFRGNLLRRCRSQVKRNRNFQARMLEVFAKAFNPGSGDLLEDLKVFEPISVSVGAPVSAFSEAENTPFELDDDMKDYQPVHEVPDVYQRNKALVPDFSERRRKKSDPDQSDHPYVSANY